MFDVDLPSDTEAALQLLQQQFPALASRDGQATVPIVLQNQLYTVLNDRTLADRQLDELRCGCWRESWHQVALSLFSTPLLYSLQSFLHACYGGICGLKC